MKAFSRCEIVGKWFPICHVHIGDTAVEVSSFSTSGPKFGRGLTYELGRPADCDKKEFIRWRNCLQWDFTIKRLMFDPFARLIYDYMGGIEDIKKAKVRTMIPATTSFQEDCVEFILNTRMLHTIRVAAQSGFPFSRETAHFVKNLSCLIMRLYKLRFLLEMNYLLAYGSAEASLRLLWKFGPLEILLPIQSLFSKLDRLLAADRPCHSSLWVRILAFHKSLSDKPRDPLVVAAFSLAGHNSGDIPEAINIARRINRSHDSSFNELSEPRNLDNQILTKEATDLAGSVESTLSKMTDEYFVSQAMPANPQAVFSDLVFIPLALYLKVCKVFECIRERADKGFMAKQGNRIDYELLALRSLREI